MTEQYTFLPWVKTGLGAFISNNEQELEGPRAKIRADLSVRRFDISNNPRPSDELITKDFLLYGPADIRGILNSVIIRIAPRENDLDVEPNYFPYIEFSQPDFPWRYTPAAPSGAQPSGRLSPWISLIVLKEQEFERSFTESGLLSHIVINEPVNSLPDLEQSWGWAHTQITQKIPNPETLRKTLVSEPHEVTSRILSLRKLEPNSRYFAFLVPAFEVGRLAGLGLEVDEHMKGTSFAWKINGSPSEISPARYLLPVYYQWQFSTSLQRRDFESLVRRLESRTLSENIGMRKLDVTEPFMSVGMELGLQKPLFFGGVLWSPQAKLLGSNKKIDVHDYLIPNPDPENPSPEEIKKFIMKMKELVDLGESLAWSFMQDQFPSNEDPIITPPMYGKWHARKRLVSKISDDYKDPEWIGSLNINPNSPPEWLKKLKDDPPYDWLEELNLDPTNRAAAGLGTAVIQELQEELMSSAWDQAGSLREANKRLRLSQLGRTISSNIFERCFQPMQPDVLIRLVSPLHARVILKDENKSVSRIIHESPIPDAILLPSFTKIAAKRSKVHRNLFDRDAHISSGLLERLNKPASNRDPNFATLEASKPKALLTIDNLVNFPGMNVRITEEDFQGDKLTHYLSNQLIPETIRKMVKSIEASITPPESTVENLLGAEAPLAEIVKIRDRLIESLNPISTIESKVTMEVRRSERLNEEQKDKLDPIVAYPEFKRPMFESLRDLSEDLLLPGVRDIPNNTISLLETNPLFINSYMAGLNHEMARELLWREYPTDQRGSYFRQFWDVSVAVQRERLEFFHEHGEYPPVEIEEQIIERYRDIPEIHKWKDSALEEIQGISQAQKTVLLIKSDLLMRYPGAVIYASKAIFDTSNNNSSSSSKPTLPLGEAEVIKQPVFRGMIPPDVTFLGFDMSLDELIGNDENADPGYFFIIQEQLSEPRFGIDEGDGTPVDPSSLTSWNDLNWDYITLLQGFNNNIDLQNGPLKGRQISNVTWGSHAADLANILLQQPVRIAVHARELIKRQES